MMSFANGATGRDELPADGTDTKAQAEFRRVLIPVADTSQVENVVELARRTGASEARVLHLNLREIAGGRRFTLETESAATEVVEAAVFELRMAGIASSGLVAHALVGKVGQAIADEAIEWGADLIVLGSPGRGELGTRLFGSVTLRVLEHAPCPVLVASRAGKAGSHRVAESATPVAHPADLSAAPAR